MTSAMIKQIELIVEQACAAETNRFGYGIWSHHIPQVAENARRLAPRFGADPEVVEIAALLHDYAAVKDEALYEDHHLHGAVEAQKILNSFGYSPEKTEAVKHAIAAHRASVPVEKRSPEAECLANADALTHIENVASLLYLAYVEHAMGIDEGAAWVREKLQRSWRKLRDDVQDMVRETYEAGLEILPQCSASPDHSAGTAVEHRIQNQHRRP